jgi:hypothetical protein
MPSKRSKYSDPDWEEAACHTGEMAMGSIADLRHTEPRGKPFVRHYGPLGFCIDPEAYRAKPKRKRRK